MNKLQKIVVILLFASMLLIPLGAFAQVRNIDMTGCEKITYSSVLYRTVNLNIRHESAFAVDPEYVFPTNGQPIHSLTPYPEKNQDGVDIINAGFVINGTGTYMIKYAIEHTEIKKDRLMEIFVQSAGLPMVTEQIRYDNPFTCKVFEFQITERPVIPTEKEIVEIGYGIITPIIEQVEESIKINTDQTQRTSDRLSLIGIGIVIAFIVMGIMWHNSRKEKREIIDEYHLMKGQLANFNNQQVIESREIQRTTNEQLQKQKEMLNDFQVIFNLQMEGKINDLGHVIHGFWKSLNDYELNIPYYAPKPLITNTDPSSPHYIPSVVELDHQEKKIEFGDFNLDYLTHKVAKVKPSLKAKFFRKKELELPENEDTTIEKLQKQYGEIADEYADTYKKLETVKDDERVNLESILEKQSKQLSEINKKIQEMISDGY